VLGSALNLPIAAKVETLLHRNAIRDSPLWDAPPCDVGGVPVLLVGGFASHPSLLMPMADWLHRLGARCLVAPVRYGVGCGEAITRSVERALERHVEASGQEAVVIGHSRGGQVARALAVRRPELHRGVITLGSPLIRMLGVYPVVKVQIALLGLAGTFGVPGLLRAGCLWGDCCRQLRADLVGPFPDTVRFVSVFSRRDERVHWRASLDPAAEHVEVSTTHTGLIFSPDSLAVIAAQLQAIL
jgi:triacylglycerol lipase